MTQNLSQFLRHIQLDLKSEVMDEDRQTNDSWLEQPKGIIQETVQAIAMFWLLKNHTRQNRVLPSRPKVQRSARKEQKSLEDYLFDLSYDEHRTVVHHEVADGCLEECLERLLRWEQCNYGTHHDQYCPETPILDLRNPFFYSNNTSMETYLHEQPLFQPPQPRYPQLDKFIRPVEFSLF